MAVDARTYAERLRETLDKMPSEKRLSTRALAKLIGVSGEHVRRVLKGEPVASQALNDRICKVLHLDPAELWQLARQGKGERKFAAHANEFPSISPHGLERLWPLLSTSERNQLERIAESFVASRRSRPPRRRRA